MESWPTFGVDLHLELDPGTGRRVGLEQALRDAVRSGRLAPDARLPASRRLAADLGLSRGTVRAAYDQLIAEGYLVARQGSGTRVARLPHHRDIGLAADAPARADTGSDHPRRDRPRHDLRPGSPDVAAFPTGAWLRSARKALGTAPAEVYGYGDPRGRIELRTALAEYLGRARGVHAPPHLIVVTSGYVQALAVLTRALADTGVTSIAMEDPGAPFHREVVRRNGAEVVALPVDGLGARTDLLSAGGFPEVGAVEVTPAHQYPTGETLHPRRRRALTDWARACGGLVLENDYDGEFRYDRQPVGAVQGTAPDHVVYLGTASKTLGPALRLGWMVVPPRLLEPVVEAKRLSDHHTEVIGQLTLADFIDRHAYDRHIRTCRLRYQRRRDRLVERVGGRFAVHGVAAGLQALIELPVGGPTELEVIEEAASRGLVVGHLGDRWHEPGDHPQGLIVGYATPAEHAYAGALTALDDALAAAAGRLGAKHH